MSNVAVVKCGSYERSEVEDAFGRGLSLLAPDFIAPSGQGKLLLKPNFLYPAPRESCVNTDPEVVRAAAVALGRGFTKVVCADSPGLGTASKASKRSGLDEALSGTGVEVFEFSETAAVRGRLFRDLPLSADALSAGFMVNLAKMKTHGQMGMTMAVKNTFGCVVGLEKARWHMKVGEDREAFARLLVDVSASFPKTLHVLDAVMAMEGNGPGHGKPRKVGALLMSTDPVALDRIACGIAGFDHRELLIFDAAEELGYGETDAAKIQVSGDDPAALRVANFVPARKAGLLRLIPVPNFILRRVRKYFSASPAVSKAACRGCAACAKACPAAAIRIDGGKAVIDRGKCIRCFCCQEICPDGAISVKKPLL